MKKLAGLAFSMAVLAASAPGQSNVTTTNGGTAGQVPAFTSGTNIENSPIAVSGEYVGIGTTNPGSALTIAVDGFLAGAPQLLIQGKTNWAYQLRLGYDTTNNFGWLQASQSGVANRPLSLNPNNGDVLIGTTTDCNSVLCVNGPSFFGGAVGIGTTSPGATLEVNGNFKFTANSGASITFADGTVQSTAYTGISCGGDFAESVDVSGQRNKYEPGDLLVIDPKHPGEFQEAARPYSMLVAGIYSTKPGYVGRRLTGPKRPNEVPLAMVGIVPTKVTAENGPIHTGDLLVTSSTPGRAMKGTDRSRLTGAVVGKALGNLDSGEGTIEVLVTLQ